MFGILQEEQVAKAAAAVSCARRGGYADGDSMDLVAAGAALAMERGAPQLMGETHDTTAGRYLESGTLAFRKLTAGVARAIEQGRQSPSENLRLVVADVCQQVSAMKIVAAAGNSDFESGLNEAQRTLALHAREDPSFRREMSAIRFGNYHELSPAMSASVAEALRRPLSPDLERAVVDLSVSVDSIARRAHGVAADLERFPDEEHMRAVIAFHSQGRATGSSSVDGALGILRDRGDGMDFGEMEPAKHVAQARLVANAPTLEGRSAAQIASWAAGDARIMTTAMEEVVSSPRPSRDLELIALGRYDELGEGRGAAIMDTVTREGMTPALDRVAMELAFPSDPSSGPAPRSRGKGMDPAMIAAMRSGMGR